MKTKEEIIELYIADIKNLAPKGRAKDNRIAMLEAELTEKESEVRTAEEILMGILESFDMYLRKAYGEIRFNYDDAAGFVKKLYISDEFAFQFQQPEITDENIIVNIRRILVDYHRRDDYDLTKAENDMLCLFRNTFVSLKLQPEKEQPSESNPRIRSLGIATTIGELKKLIKNYPDDTSFGFRNQPMQKLYEVKYDDIVFVTFQ